MMASGAPQKCFTDLTCLKKLQIRIVKSIKYSLSIELDPAAIPKRQENF